MKVLTPAEERAMMLLYAKNRWMDRAVKAEAENARLRGLIEGMGHEQHCSSREIRFRALVGVPTGKKCNCIQSKIHPPEEPECVDSKDGKHCRGLAHQDCTECCFCGVKAKVNL